MVWVALGLCVVAVVAGLVFLLKAYGVLSEAGDVLEDAKRLNDKAKRHNDRALELRKEAEGILARAEEWTAR